MLFMFFLLFVFNIESRVIKIKIIEYYKNKLLILFFNNFIVLWDYKVFFWSKVLF